jgi:hypothetical protein
VPGSPSPSWIACHPPKARVKTLAEAWIPKENIFYAVGVRVMDVSMVIAAWGEGVGLSVSPSSSSDRSSLAKTRVKNWLGSSDAPPFAARIPAPTQRLIRKKGQKNCGVLTFSFSYTRMRQYSPIGLYYWLIP